MGQRPQLWCADCGAVMHRSKGSLPQGEARCRPCRRHAVLSQAPAECALCSGPLTERQRLDGGRFCSRSCAYKQFRGIPFEPRDYKRQRLLGGIRPMCVERDDLGLPSHSLNVRGDAPLHEGPLRLLWITRRHYDDGHVEVRCPVCRQATAEVSQAEAWCSPCAVVVHVESPTPKEPRPSKPARQPRACPVCDALHMRLIYCSPECCRTENERRKAEARRKPPRTECPQGHPYSPENRRVRTRMRPSGPMVETECKPCHRAAKRG